MKEYVSFAEAGASLPKPKSADSLRRWATVGCEGILLPTLWVGGTPLVKPSDLAGFCEKVSAAKRAKAAARRAKNA